MWSMADEWMAQGFKIGRANSRAIGRAEAAHIMKIETAKKLLAQNTDPVSIAAATGLKQPFILSLIKR